MRRTGRICLGDTGFALLAVLVVLLIVSGASAAFIWFMNRQQAFSGRQYRGVAAMTAAEAGVHRALAALETVSPDGQVPGRTWRPLDYSEDLNVGAASARFTVSLQDDPDGSVVVTSAGQAGGVTRRLRARVSLASPALLAALNGTGILLFQQPPAATFVVPYGAVTADRPWFHIASSQGILFATGDVSINDPAVRFEVGPGPVDGPVEGAGTAPRVEPIRLLLALDAGLRLGPDLQRIELGELRAEGIHFDAAISRVRALPPFPEVDSAFYQARAAVNTENAVINEAAGDYFGDLVLGNKRDSHYSAEQFARLLAYFLTGRQRPRLAGVVYVKGGMELLGDQRLQITEGALITEGTVRLAEGASLEVTHSASTRTLPGMLILNDGGLVVTSGASLRVHGLVYARRAMEVGGRARVDIVGAVLDRDPMQSFRNLAATVVIRYDPAVMGTPGLRVPGDAPVVAWVAAWEELP